MAITRLPTAGQKNYSANFRQFFGDFFPEGIKTGFVVSDNGGIEISISAGTAYVKDADDGMYQVTSDAAELLTLTNNATNYVYLHCATTYLTSSTSATVPDDAVLLSTVVCASGDITSVTNVTIGLPSYVPTGVIVAWSGLLASIPSGWFLCDGNNGTPNLIDRFLQGITTSTTEPGTTGGAHSITIGTTGLYADGQSFVQVTRGATFNNRPKYYEVAWIMKA